MLTDIKKATERVELLARIIETSGRTAAKSADATERSVALCRIERCVAKLHVVFGEMERAGQGAALAETLQRRGMMT